MLRYALSGALMLAWVLAPPPHEFPGPNRELRSPDGAFTVLWWEPDTATPRHSLLLKARGSPKTWRIREFERSVLVTWSPRGHMLAITDRQGSDASSTFVHFADSGHVVDACSGPMEALGKKWRLAHHRYCEQEGWTSSTKLRLRLWGYGDGVDFETHATVSPK